MWYLILMKPLLQPVSIVCEVDPALAPPRTTALYRGNFRLRLLPVKGGVCLIRGGVSRAVHGIPASLALELLGCAENAGRSVVRAARSGRFERMRVYFEDKREFYRAAARAVETDSRVLRMWGLS